MPFNSNLHNQRRAVVSSASVHDDLPKSIQLLLSGAQMFLLSKTPEGYIDPLMAKGYSRPNIAMLAFEKQSGKYFLVPSLLYDLVLGNGKAPDQKERDGKILNYIVNGGQCPVLDAQTRAKIEEMRTKYSSKINELKREKR